MYSEDLFVPTSECVCFSSVCETGSLSFVHVAFFRVTKEFSESHPQRKIFVLPHKDIAAVKTSNSMDCVRVDTKN